MCTTCAAVRPWADDCLYANINEGTDAPFDLSTPYSISVGDTFTGSIGYAYDGDAVSIQLVAGQTYTIILTGVTNEGGTLPDPYLTLYDANGTLVAENDDGAVSGAGYDSVIIFTATSSGTYYIGAQSYTEPGYTGTGTYTLGVIGSDGPGPGPGPTDEVFTHDEIADQLVNGYWESNGSSGRGFNVSAGGTLTVNITSLSAEGQALALAALQAWSAVTGITFQTTNGNAQIMFQDSDPDGAYSTSQVSNGVIQSSMVNVPPSWLNQLGTSLDTYSFQTYIHEIGHALGLGHAGNYNGSATYGVDNHYLNDSWQASIMSYMSQDDNTYVDASLAYIMTPMIADILAIQSIYGTPAQDMQAGNTVWGANSNIGGYLGALFGQVFGEDPQNGSVYAGNTIAFAIFDTGGRDTLNLAPVTEDQRIDLRPESYSDIMGLTGNLAIARGTVIENAIGGSASDWIGGNGVANRLLGRAGDDTLIGRGGNDALIGGGGSDTLQGNAGRDILKGGGGNDTALGHAGLDKLFGGGGNDTLNGGGGNDILNGGGGNDRMIGGGGNDRFVGGAGNDRMTGGAGADAFVFNAAQAGRDIITDFNAAQDRILINLGNFGANSVEVDHRNGDTIISYGNGNTTITLDGVTLSENDITFVLT